MLALSRFCLRDGAVGAASTGEVALGDDRHLRVRQRAAAVQGRDGDAAADAEFAAGLDDREVEAVVEQQVVQSLRRSGAVGGDDDAVAAPDAARSGDR